MPIRTGTFNPIELPLIGVKSVHTNCAQDIFHGKRARIQCVCVSDALGLKGYFGFPIIVSGPKCSMRAPSCGTFLLSFHLRNILIPFETQRCERYRSWTAVTGHVFFSSLQPSSLFPRWHETISVERQMNLLEMVSAASHSTPKAFLPLDGRRVRAQSETLARASIFLPNILDVLQRMNLLHRRHMIWHELAEIIHIYQF